MNRLLSIIFVSVFSISLLAGCGSDDKKPSEDGEVEGTTDAEAAETGGAGEADDGTEEITRTIDKLDEEGWIFHAGVNLTIPDEFPSDYPTLDNYTVVETRVGEPDSLIGEIAEVKYKYTDASNFLEAVNFYTDYYENGDFVIENKIINVEPTDEEGFIQIDAQDDEGIKHFFAIDKLHSEDFYQVHITIRVPED